MWAVWNEWKEDEEEHVWDSDAIFRRIYWVPDDGDHDRSWPRSTTSFTADVTKARWSS